MLLISRNCILFNYRLEQENEKLQKRIDTNKTETTELQQRIEVQDTKIN